MKVGELFIVLDTKLDKFNKGMSDAERAMVRVGQKFTAVGKKLTMMVTLPILAVGAAAVKMGADFEQSMMNAASVSGATGEELKRMEGIAREMGETTVFSAKQSADAMYFMASAGWKVNDMGKAIKPTLDLAAATQSDLAFTTDTVVASLNQFQLGSGGAERVTNVFAAAIGNSQATMEKLSASMRYVGPLFNSMGKSVEEAAATLMVLYNAGYDASMAGTALRMGMVKLMDGTKKTTDALARLGLKLKDVDPTTMHFADIIEILGERGAKTKDVIDIFGVRAGPAFAALISQGGDAIRKFEKEITGTNAAAKMAEMQINTLKGSFKLLTSALTEAAIQIFKVLGPGIKDLVDNKLKPAVLWFNKLSEGTKKTIITVAGLAAAAGPLLLIFGKLLVILPKIKVALAALTGPFGLITAALVLIIAKTFSAIATFKKFSESLNKYLDASGEKMSAFSKTWTGLTATIHKYVYGVDYAKIATEKYAEMTKKAKKETEEYNKKAYDTIRALPMFKKGLDFVKGSLDKVKSSLEGTTEEEKKLIETTTKIIPKIKDEKTEIENLESKYWDLMAKVFKGEVAWQTLINQAVEIKSKISALKDEFSDLDMAIEDDAEEWIDFGDTTNTVLEDMGYGLGSIPDKAEDATKKTKSAWDKMADGLQTKWASAFGDMIKGTKSFVDGLSSLWDAITSQFADMIGAMVAKWLAGLMKMKLAAKSSKLTSWVDDLAAGAASAIPIIGAIIGAISLLANAFKDLGPLTPGAEWSITPDQLQKPKDGVGDEGKPRLDEWGQALEDLAGRMEQYGDLTELTLAQQKELNDAWVDAISLAKEYGMEGSKSFTDLIKLMRELGLESQALTAYINDQLGVIKGNSMSAAEGLEAMAAGVGNNEAAMARLESQTLAVYNAMIENGATANQAMESLGPTLDAIAEKHEEMGTTASAAIQELLKVREITEAHKGLMTAIEGNNAVLTALANTGSLNQEILDDSAKSAKSYYKQLINAGMSGNQALAQMAPTLANLAYLAEEHGYKLDKNTQKLYDEAVAAGYVAKEQMSANDIMLAGFGEIIKALGGEIPAAMQEAMGKMKEFGTTGEEASKGIADAADDAMDDVERALQDAVDAGEISAEDMDKAMQDAFRHMGEAANAAAGDIQDNLDGLHAPDLTVDIDGDFGKLNRQLKDWSPDGKGRKTIPAFQHGGFVEETGLAYVHKGEWVLPKVATQSLLSANLPRPMNIQPVLKTPGNQGESVMNTTVNIYAQKLDDYTINTAAEKIFAAVERQEARRGGR